MFFQSGFKLMHRTASDFFRVLILSFLPLTVVLVLLDLTSTFDTVNTRCLDLQLEQWGGMRGIALDWFRSYMETELPGSALVTLFPPLLLSHEEPPPSPVSKWFKMPFKGQTLL